MRWFRGQIEGSYVGSPSPTAVGPARRLRLQVYRAALRELEWIEPVAQPESPGVEPNALWQAQIDHAHLAGVRGPGTWYEGPIFDVRIRGLSLSHPTEHAGRSYGRIVGEAVGWLELPPPPEPPDVSVNERPAAEAPRAEPLEGTVYQAPAAEDDTNTPAHEAEQAAGAVDDEAVPDAAAESGEAARSKNKRPSAGFALVAWVALLALALGLKTGVLALSIWCVLMLPTLAARTLFGGVLRDSGFVRGCGYAAIAIQLLCSSPLLPILSGQCVEPAWWTALVVVLLLFPTGLLPASAPLATSAIALALVLTGLTQRSDPRCAHLSEQPGDLR